MIKNYGLILPEIKTKEQGAEHLLGGANDLGVVIKLNGDWTPFLPDKEPQNVRGIETNSCTIYGTLNALETLILFKTGIQVDYSNRYLANVAKKYGKLNPSVGADPHSILELVRTIVGCLKEDRLPDWTDEIKTVDDYYALQELTELMIEGKRWYDEWELEHKWLWNTGDSIETKHQKLKEGLTKGTCCVSVVAWVEENGIFVKPKGTTDGHWTMAKNIDTEGYPFVFDSYDGFIKKLSKDYDFSLGKVLYLNVAQAKQDWFQSILDWIKSIIPFLKKQVDEVAPIIPIDQTPPPPAPPIVSPVPKPSKIQIWAKAIQVQEGYFVGSRSFKNNNPGNLKYTDVTKNLGATGKDAGNFCIFPNYETGFNALCRFLVLACENRLTPYRDATLVQFTTIYARPPNMNYVNAVAKVLGVPITTLIKTLL